MESRSSATGTCGPVRATSSDPSRNRVEDKLAVTLDTYLVRAVTRIFKLSRLPGSILATSRVLTLVPLVCEPPILRGTCCAHVVVFPGLGKKDIASKTTGAQVDCEPVNVLPRKVLVNRAGLAVFGSFAITIQVRKIGPRLLRLRRRVFSLRQNRFRFRYVLSTRKLRKIV